MAHTTQLLRLRQFALGVREMGKTCCQCQFTVLTLGNVLNHARAEPTHTLRPRGRLAEFMHPAYVTCRCDDLVFHGKVCVRSSSLRLRLDVLRPGVRMNATK